MHRPGSTRLEGCVGRGGFSPWPTMRGLLHPGPGLRNIRLISPQTMIDSHCHLTSPQLFSQIDAVLARAGAAGVGGVIAIGTDVEDARRAIALCAGRPQVRCAVGLAAGTDDADLDARISALRELARNEVVRALGEMGLEYHHRHVPPPAVQLRVLLRQLDLARELRLPAVLHCREAVDDMLAALKDFPQVRAVFHCFTGTVAEARRIIERGYALSLAGVVTFRNGEELRRVARFVPADRLLLETDAPYLTPEPLRGRRKVNEPALLVHTAAAVAAARAASPGDIGELAAENARRFFGL